jgi:hypothetical protein
MDDCHFSYITKLKRKTLVPLQRSILYTAFFCILLHPSFHAHGLDLPKTTSNGSDDY